MKTIQHFIVVVMVGLLSACSSSSDNKKPNLPYDELNALEAAQAVVREKYASDAEFDNEKLKVEKTEVRNRFKVVQRFDSDIRDGRFFVYRIWVQKFGSEWEYGTLEIEDVSGNKVHFSKGEMKERELDEMLSPKTGSTGNVDYIIIKQNEPNYVRVYTPERLSRDEVLEIYNQLKNKYETIYYSKSTDPDDEEYMTILNGLVCEHDIDKVTKLADY